ncbi:MAG: hypothetical protein FWH41_06590 [Treponema sp.]|nr:hypothetical protein [Treponema sp.]
MKYLVKRFLIIFSVMLIGLFFVACNNDPVNRTTWSATEDGMEAVLTFNSPNFTISVGEDTIEGSYSVSGNTVSMAGREDGAGKPFTGTGTLAGNFLTIVDNNNNSLMFEKQ